jgi:NAD(P)-dependent dehydrogenase (short-subunit alcohol dehydrogenase family)
MNQMNIELKGCKAIVTGSTAGIGRATAEGLARAGASVVINGRQSGRVDEAVRQMRQAFPDGDISGVAADLSTAAGAETVFAQTSDADILVNNGGRRTSATTTASRTSRKSPTKIGSGCSSST